MDDHTVLCWLDICTHTAKSFGDDCNTVRFLYLQLCSIADHSGTLCKSSHYSNHRNLIDERGDNRALHCCTVKLTGADQQVCHRLSLLINIQKGDICTHGPAHLQDSISGRINPYIPEKDLAVWSEKPCCNKIGSRGNISRHLDLPGL